MATYGCEQIRSRRLVDLRLPKIRRHRFDQGSVQVVWKFRRLCGDTEGRFRCLTSSVWEKSSVLRADRAKVTLSTRSTAKGRPVSKPAAGPSGRHRQLRDDSSHRPEIALTDRHPTGHHILRRQALTAPPPNPRTTKRWGAIRGSANSGHHASAHTLVLQPRFSTTAGRPHAQQDLMAPLQPRGGGDHRDRRRMQPRPSSTQHSEPTVAGCAGQRPARFHPVPLR